MINYSTYWQLIGKPSRGSLISTALATLVITNVVPKPAFSQACPEEGCIVEIASIQPAGDEFIVQFRSNFQPEMSGNHFHLWWKSELDVRSMSLDEEVRLGDPKGEWDPTENYPLHVTTGASSFQNRGDSNELCVSAGDARHNIIDPDVYDCKSVPD